MKAKAERLALVSRIAEVKWVDSNATHGWHDDEEIDITLCQSVGYVVKEDDAAIHLSESINLMVSSRFGCTTSIPKTAVKSVRYLRGKR